jgi:hypothetical protein
MSKQEMKLSAADVAFILRDVVLVMLGGIRQAFPAATQDDTSPFRVAYDTDDGIVEADEAIHFLLGKAMRDFHELGEPECSYEQALDQIKDETKKLVEWYIRLKPASRQ